MDEAIEASVAGVEAYVVGGAVRDELLDRAVLDTDVACRDPERAARAFREATGGAVFLLSERHGAWRVAFRDGRTVDFTELRGTIEDDLGGRDFTINAIAVPVSGGEAIDPFGGRDDLGARRLRVVSDGVFTDDALRLLRAIRLEDELGVRLEPWSEELVRKHAGLAARPAGERIVAELLRLSIAGYRRLDELGLLRTLGGSMERLEPLPATASPGLLLVAALGDSLRRLPVPNELKRLSRIVRAAKRPHDASPREIHRFRRATEPWALETLAYLGAGELAPAVEASRAADPAEPLLRGDELDVEPGPEVGRLLALIAEERAAGAITTREDALELVRRERSRV